MMNNVNIDENVIEYKIPVSKRYLSFTCKVELNKKENCLVFQLGSEKKGEGIEEKEPGKYFLTGDEEKVKEEFNKLKDEIKREMEQNRTKSY